MDVRKKYKTMAASINGIGTRFYGASSPRSDGSVITTKWFAIIFMPIFPLSSYRVIRETKGDKFLIFGYSSAYSIAEKLPIQWTQVLKTYTFAIIFFVWMVGAGLGLGEIMERWHPSALVHWAYLLAVFPIPFYVLAMVRSRERKASKLRIEETEQGAPSNR